MLNKKLIIFFFKGIPLSPVKTSNAFLLHIKGIAVCLDPLLYSWIDGQLIQSASLSSVKTERERKKRAPSLTRTSSIGTPRKKSFARGDRWDDEGRGRGMKSK